MSDPKSDHISRYRDTTARLMDAIQALIQEREYGLDNGYEDAGSEYGPADNVLTQADFVGDNSAVQLADFVTGRDYLTSLIVIITPDFRRAVNRIRR